MTGAHRTAEYDFSGLVAVITGGGAGIGAAIGARLRQTGATVCIWDLAADPADPDTAPVDVSDLKSVTRAAQAVRDRHGRLDFLINNAGFSGPTVPLEAFDPAVWARIISVNLLGVFNVCHAAIPLMRGMGAGRIVNIASLAGKEGTPNSSAYSASKAGVIALTKSLGKELADSGILVNAVAPAAVRTSLLDQMTPQHVQTMIDKSPLKRLGEPREVAELVAWLCSDSCTFSTGAVFDLSGGRATY